MNRKQEQIIERLKTAILLHDGLGQTHVDRYEYKKFEVEEKYNLVFLLTEVGSKTDEGTWASLLCRTRRHILVGKKGGVRLLNAVSYHHGKKHSVHSKKTPQGWFQVIHSLTI